MTTLEFYERVCALPEKYDNRKLESYLSALLLMAQKERTALTEDKLLQLLEAAFTGEEIAFDDRWLEIRIEPDPDTSNSDKEYSISVIKFQIAELHRMRDMPHTDEWSSLGMASPTGNYWYNFDPFSNLECGARSFIDSGPEGIKQELVCNWKTLGELLERGRLYE